MGIKRANAGLDQCARCKEVETDMGPNSHYKCTYKALEICYALGSAECYICSNRSLSGCLVDNNAQHIRTKCMSVGLSACVS